MDEEIKKEIEKVWEKLEELESKITEQRDIESSQPTTKGKKLSVKEYIKERTPNNDVQRTIVIADYLEKIESKEEFVTKDISEGFRKAKLKVPANVPDKIQKAIFNGWIANGKNKGGYYLTSSGEEAIKNSFNKK